MINNSVIREAFLYDYLVPNSNNAGPKWVIHYIVRTNHIVFLLCTELTNESFEFILVTRIISFDFKKWHQNHCIIYFSIACTLSSILLHFGSISVANISVVPHNTLIISYGQITCQLYYFTPSVLFTIQSIVTSESNTYHCLTAMSSSRVHCLL